MTLGLFNCRIIQPAGDQLFFFAEVNPKSPLASAKTPAAGCVSQARYNDFAR
jgi:hypothetical protein